MKGKAFSVISESFAFAYRRKYGPMEPSEYIKEQWAKIERQRRHERFIQAIKKEEARSASEAPRAETEKQ